MVKCERNASFISRNEGLSAFFESDLDSKLNLLVGENGIGKTSILRAARLLLGQAIYLSVGAPIRLRIPRPTPDDFRRTIRLTPDGRRKATYATRCTIKGTMVHQGKEIEVELTKPAPAPSKTALPAPLDASGGRPLPVFAYYSAHRGTPGKRTSQRMAPYNPSLPDFAAHYDALYADTSFSQFVNWFEAEEKTELRDMREGLPPSRNLEAVRLAFEKLFEGSEVRYNSPRFMPRGVGLVFTQTNPDGTQTIAPFDELADGYRCMLAIVGGLCTQAHPSLRRHAGSSGKRGHPAHR